MAEILQNLQPNTAMNTILVMVALIFVMIIWNIQRDKDNQVDVKDLICTNGQLNEHKFMRFTAFVVSTWGFVYLIVDQRFSEWYFAGYMATWTGSALLNKWLNAKSNTSADKEPQ